MEKKKVLKTPDRKRFPSLGKRAKKEKGERRGEN